MPDKKTESEFKVNDRRRFSSEGTVVNEAPESEEKSTSDPTPILGTGVKDKPALELTRDQAPAAKEDTTPSPPPEATRPGPSAQQKADSSRAYKKSTDEMDAQIRQELGGKAMPDDFKIGFDRIVEPLYVTALVQLGFMGQENQAQRRVDIIGARQSIDALTLLQEKTQGNLQAGETSLLEDVLYDVRMKYMEVTNALARAVQNPPPGKPGGSKA
jgi:hypothetical protein